MTSFWRGMTLLAVLLIAFASPASAQENTVRAVLFFSPTCPHCQAVVEGTLLPMMEHYGDQLEVLAISTATPEGQELYWATIERFQIPNERQGVPLLIIGETNLVGSGEIPEQFPVLVEIFLAQGGIDWPDIPGLPELLQEVQTQETEATAPEAASPSPTPMPADGEEGQNSPEELLLAESTRPALLRDPLGNALSIAVLIGMLISATKVGINLKGNPTSSDAGPPGWGIPTLSMVGILIAGYLAFVETTGTEAVCGPVGDCNTVQQSQYAILFGVLPVGVFGILGYLAILVAWVGSRLPAGTLTDLSRVMLFSMTAFGVLFSIYLTFLEPFVIGATCAWCLSSAIIMTVLMWMASSPAKPALARLRAG